MTAEQRGPTGTIDRHHLEQPSYRFGTDRLPCCGCVIHSGPETSDCECRCHWASRLLARKEFTEVKR